MRQPAALQDLLVAGDDQARDQGVGAEAGGDPDGHLGMRGGEGLALLLDALFQPAGEQQVWERDEPPRAKAPAALQAIGDGRGGDAGVAAFNQRPRVAFPQQACELGDVGVGVRVGRPAAAEQHGSLGPLRLGHGLVEPLAGEGQQVRVQPERAAVAQAHAGMVEPAAGQQRGDVVLGVAGGEQHQRHHRDVGGTAGDEPGERVRN